jgi:hypothetical protein
MCYAIYQIIIQRKINMPSNKKTARREQAIKREKRKKLINFAIVAVVILAIAGVVSYFAVRDARAEIYTDGYATVTLYEDGKFSATLYHGESIKGTYVKAIDGNTIVFSNGAQTEISIIEEGILLIPAGWDDGHGHGAGLPLKR